MTNPLLEIDRRVTDLERGRGLELVRPTVPTIGIELRALYQFPPIPTDRARIIWMVFNRPTLDPGTPREPDPGGQMYNGLFWASPGDDRWQHMGGKTGYNYGTPGTFHDHEPD